MIEYANQERYASQESLELAHQRPELWMLLFRSARDSLSEVVNSSGSLSAISTLHALLDR